MFTHRYWSVAILAVGLCAGCRNDPFATAYIESVNQENRQLEDELYQKEYELQKLRNQARRQSKEAEVDNEDGPPRLKAPRKSSSSGSKAGGKSLEDKLAPPRIEFEDAAPSIEGPSPPRLNNRPNLSPPAEAKPAPETEGISAPALEEPPIVPKLDDPAPSPPGRTSMPRQTLSLPPRSAPKPSTPPPSTPAPAEELPTPKSSVKGIAYEAPLERSRPGVEEIVLNAARTGGLQLDQQAGDDGVSVWLEPRDADGKLLLEPGAVSIVAVDPSLTGPRARIARWDLTSQQVSQRIVKQGPARGYHLQLPWPGRAPESPEVRVVLRYETSDGRKLETSRDIQITLSPEPLQRWVPRSNGRHAVQLNATNLLMAELPSIREITSAEEVSEVEPEAAETESLDIVETPIEAPDTAPAPPRRLRPPPVDLSDEADPLRPIWKPER